MIIIPCGGKKVESTEFVRAQDLYTGAFFKCLISVAKTLDTDIKIMSAGYGLIDINCLVKPYEKKMDKETAKLVNSLLKSYNLKWDKCYHLLPKMYASALEGFNVPSLIPPVTGMGYFMQEALKIKGAQELQAPAIVADYYPTLLSNYRGHK
jgi:hypothetical protein